MMIVRNSRLNGVLAVLVALGLIVCGCSAKRQMQKPESASKDAPYEFEKEGDIPPLEESEVVEEPDFEEVPLAEEEVFEEEMDIPPAEELAVEQAPPAEMTDGYRVQVFATGDEETAEAVREAGERKLGVPVYTEYVDGLYKVRVGDCLAREEAEVLLKRCKATGYGDAWIVETRVLASRGQ
jgi:cell division septation protein DedD